MPQSTICQWCQFASPLPNPGVYRLPLATLLLVKIKKLPRPHLRYSNGIDTILLRHRIRIDRPHVADFLRRAGAREIWIDQSGFSRWEKSSVLKSSKQVRKGFEIRQLFSLEMALHIHEKGIYIFLNHTSLQKVKNMNHFVFLSFYFGAKTWVARSSSSVAR